MPPVASGLLASLHGCCAHCTALAAALRASHPALWDYSGSINPERPVVAATDDEGAAMGERPLKVGGWPCGEHSRSEHSSAQLAVA